MTEDRKPYLVRDPLLSGERYTRNRSVDNEQLERVLAAINDNRKSLGWVPQTMKQYTR